MVRPGSREVVPVKQPLTSKACEGAFHLLFLRERINNLKEEAGRLEQDLVQRFKVPFIARGDDYDVYVTSDGGNGLRTTKVPVVPSPSSIVDQF